MKRTAYLGLIAFVFAGCTNNSALELFKKDELFEKALIYTKKGDVINSLETKAIVNATYLNPVDDEFKSKTKESFIVGIYIVDDEIKEDKKYIKNPSYKITLNDKNATDINEINSTHKMYSHIPVKNTWAKYYCINFDKNESAKILKLKYSHKTFGNVVLKFDAD